MVLICYGFYQIAQMHKKEKMILELRVKRRRKRRKSQQEPKLKRPRVSLSVVRVLLKTYDTCTLRSRGPELHMNTICELILSNVILIEKSIHLESCYEVIICIVFPSVYKFSKGLSSCSYLQTVLSRQADNKPIHPLCRYQNSFQMVTSLRDRSWAIKMSKYYGVQIAYMLFWCVLMKGLCVHVWGVN